MVELRECWAEPLARHERVRFHTSRKPGFAGGVATVELEGVDSEKLCAHLWEKHRIFTVAIKHADFQGLRISPSVYTQKSELERFVEAMEAVLRKGLTA
jgi:selenocysteine lyase/cysteine desulfurase